MQSRRIRGFLLGRWRDCADVNDCLGLIGIYLLPERCRIYTFADAGGFFRQAI